MNLNVTEVVVKIHFYSKKEKELLSFLQTEAKGRDRTVEEAIYIILYSHYRGRLKVVEKGNEQKLTEGC